MVVHGQHVLLDGLAAPTALHMTAALAVALASAVVEDGVLGSRATETLLGVRCGFHHIR